jgi:hypothetical protein
MGQFMEGIIEDVKKTSRDVVSLLGDRFEDDEDEKEEEEEEEEEDVVEEDADADPRLAVAAQQQQQQDMHSETELSADSTLLGELAGDVRRFELAR